MDVASGSKVVLIGEHGDRVARPAPTDEELMEVASLLVDIVHDLSVQAEISALSETLAYRSIFAPGGEVVPEGLREDEGCRRPGVGEDPPQTTMHQFGYSVR